MWRGDESLSSASASHITFYESSETAVSITVEHEKIAQHDGNNNAEIMLLLGCYKVTRQKVIFTVEFDFVEILNVQSCHSANGAGSTFQTQ